MIPNFTPEQIQQAYQRTDTRLFHAISEINLDKVVFNLRQKFALPVDKLDDLKTSIEFTIVGLITAKELNNEIKLLFPTQNIQIIEYLNQAVFVPVLEYVKKTPKLTLSNVPVTTGEDGLRPNTSPLRDANIEIIDQPELPNYEPDTAFSEIDKNSEPASPLVTLIDNIPIKPGFKTKDPRPVLSQKNQISGDQYREPI